MPTRTVFGAYADGAPLNSGAPPAFDASPDGVAITPPPVQGSVVDRATRAVGRIRTIEGPRGIAERSTVVVRHVGQFVVILLSCGVTHWAFAPQPSWRYGGLVMLYSIAFIMVVAAVGTVLYADSRMDVVRQARHFAFGIVALPGAALALFMRLINQALTGPGTEEDMFVSVLRGNGLPLVFFSLVTIPAVVFAKYVFGGIRSANRSALTDEEMLATYTRQDGWQR